MQFIGCIHDDRFLALMSKYYITKLRNSNSSDSSLLPILLLLQVFPGLQVGLGAQIGPVDPLHQNHLVGLCLPVFPLDLMVRILLLVQAFPTKIRQITLISILKISRLTF